MGNEAKHHNTACPVSCYLLKAWSTETAKIVRLNRADASTWEPSPPKLTSRLLNAGVRLHGLIWGAITSYASTNLTEWAPIYTNPPTSGIIQFLDTQSKKYRARFYRAIEQ